MVKKKLEPRPGLLSIHMLPPIASHSDRLIISPRRGWGSVRCPMGLGDAYSNGGGLQFQKRKQFAGLRSVIRF